ncbi:coiled-coil domain-containing protein 162-like isoform X2 [Hyperolius riggenbachi]
MVRSTGEEASWVNAAQGGSGVPGGLGSHQYIHQTPADFQVHSAQFMEFSEVENHNDYYTMENGIIHTQDQKGAFIVYDVAIDDLQELQHQLLLLTTLFIEREKNFRTSTREASEVELSEWAHINVDRFALLLDLWTWECALLESKQQLVDSYYEAYQHVCDPEERFSLAQVITDIMYQRPQFDIGSKYFLEAYRDECQCLRLHLQLVRNVLNNQIETQREFVQKVWRDGRKGGFLDFGLPLNVITKLLVSLNTSSPALKNVYLLEFHPSLGLAYLIPKTLQCICEEFQHICRAKTPKEAYSVRKRILELALNEWSSPRILQSFFMANVNKDLFEGMVVEDPVMVRDICMVVLNSADEDKKHGRAKQVFILETFSKMLELITLRHRIIEASLETALLSRTYVYFAEEMGFHEFHLYLRPIQFEFASQKALVDQTPPMFITSLLEDDSSVDRYSPSAQLLAIHEIDDNQIGKFTFWTKDGILQLLNKGGIENLQVVLLCQIIQKNALLAAAQLASFSQMSSWSANQAGDIKNDNSSIQRQMSSVSERTSSSWTVTESQTSVTPVPNGIQTQTCWLKKRIPESFVSIQLEKVGPRDAMMNTFLQKKQVMGTTMRNPEEVEKVKRELVLDYCQKLSRRISSHSLRGQIIAYCNSLKQLLEDFPLVQKTYFIIGQPQEKKKKAVKESPQADPRTFQERPHAMLTEEGKAFVNLWYIPHPAEVLAMFKMLPEKGEYRALYHTLQIVAALHDIVSYIVSFAQLGNLCDRSSCLINKELTADWGGIEGIGAELRDIQKLIDGLHNPNDPKEVASLLLLRREVMILQFDAAVRHMIRDALLSAGNISAFRATTDNMYHGLTAMSDSVVRSAFSSQLTVPQPLDPRSHRTFMLYPWRTFLADGGIFPLMIYGIHTIGHNMQLCLCDMTDHEHSVAHGELVGVHLLMEDILQGNYNFISFSVEGNLDAGKKSDERFASFEEQPMQIVPKKDQCEQDPVSEYRQLRSFLILWKQLEVFKEKWGKIKLRVEEINTVQTFKQFCELYRDEIFYPTMKVIAQQMGKEEEFEGLTLRSQDVLPPIGASEIDIRVRQVQKIMECFECDMIHDVQKKVAKEMTLVMSEKALEGGGVPTELWKKPSMTENFSPVRPQIVEKFVQKLMSECRDNAAEVSFKKEHLEHCLTSLACDITAREQSDYLSYSMFYENLLQQEHQLLYQKEQELLAVTGEQKKNENGLGNTADVSHDLMVEITALRAKLQDMEEKSTAAAEVVRKQVQGEYEALVRTLFATCVSLKSTIDGYQINMNKQVTDLISEVRKEGVDNMIHLRKKYGSIRNDSSLENTLSLKSLEDDNFQLQALFCKLKAMNKWKITAKEGQLREKLRNAEKEAVHNKREGLKLKLVVEQEVALLRQELMIARTTLLRTQSDASKLNQQLIKQKQCLSESEHKLSQETRRWQQLDSVNSSNMDRLLENIEDKEQKLRSLVDEVERTSKMGQLQQNKVKKEVKQIKTQLVQERHLKLDAFQRVDELQTQVYDMETGNSVRSTPIGLRKGSGSLLSLKARSHSAVSCITSAAPFHFTQEAWDILPYGLPAESRASTNREMRLQRPKTVPSRCKGAELADYTSQAILTQLHELRLHPK